MDCTWWVGIGGWWRPYICGKKCRRMAWISSAFAHEEGLKKVQYSSQMLNDAVFRSPGSFTFTLYYTPMQALP